MAFKKLHQDTTPQKQLDSNESQLASWGKDHLPMMFERQARSFLLVGSFNPSEKY